MSMPINTKQQWMFHSDQEIGLEPVPLKVEKQRNSTILKVGRLLEIKLIEYNRKENTIEAKYTIFDPFDPEDIIKGDVVFKADSQGGKKWVGFPTQFHGICQWTVFPLSPT